MLGPGSITFEALGTSASVVTADAGRLPAAVDAVRREVSEIDLACSRFRDDSDLARLHRARGRWTSVGPLLFEAIEVALGAALATGGMVDPTVGEAVIRSGYDRDFRDLVRDGPAFEPVPCPGWHVVGIDPARWAVYLPSGVSLDLGATAKALAADRAASSAASSAGCGVLVSLGGDLAAMGDAPPGGWTVSIADDHGGPANPGDTVAISGGGLATSSTTVRRWQRAGTAVHHVIDPRTGGPASEVWRTVSVASADCVGANTATTAALVLGDEAVGWLRDRGLPARLVRRDGSAIRVCDWPEEQAA